MFVPYNSDTLFQEKLTLSIRSELSKLQTNSFRSMMNHIMKESKECLNPRIVDSIIESYLLDKKMFGDSKIQTYRGFRGEYAFLSNMFEIPLSYEGKQFNSSEQIYQYIKASHITEDLAQEVLACHFPYQTKTLMRDYRVPTDIRLKAMTEALGTKFSDNDMASMLMLTKHVELVEYNRWNDSFWGKAIPDDGTFLDATGNNRLGIALMDIRRAISLGMMAD